ncbi:MAG: PQQ-binding-like beta-propeller repeat protein [Calditrichaeota bacterium]|nr:PQQ-binding-like beta-propeller repeat protein [Calditrichota bacterium]
MALGGCARLLLPQLAEKGDAHLWPQFGGAAQRTNVVAAELAPPLELDWQRKATASLGPTFLAAGTSILCPTKDGHLLVMDGPSGKKVAQKKFRPGFEITCALYENLLVVARRHGNPSLTVHDLGDGHLLWSAAAGSIETEPLIADGHLIVAADEKRLTAYELRSGKVLWTLNTDDNLRSTPAYAEDKVVFGSDDGRVRAVDVRKGTLIWQYRTGGAVLAPPAISHGIVCVGSTDRSFYALSLDSGLVRWVFPTGGRIRHGAAVADSVVLFGSNDHLVYCLSLRNGSERWRFRAKSIISTPPLVAGKVVYVGSLDQHVYALDLDSGRELWKYDTGGRVRTMPLVAYDRLFVAAEGNRIFAFRAKGKA